MTFLGILIVLVSIPLISGLCSTCVKGRCYDNGECIVGCVTGFVGKYCHSICPTNCVNNECYIDRIKGTVTCTDGCESGFCGAKCSRACDDGCVTCDRQCGSCNVTLCPERRYGADCSEFCNPKYEKCDRKNGQCIRCRRGYFGDECTRQCPECFTREDDLIDDCLSGCNKCQSGESCPPGFHGNSCELKCPIGCDKPGRCNRATGECSARCVSGYHGLTCNYRCSDNCLSGRCDRATGECSNGCVSGYHGLTCNYTCSGHCLSGRCNRATEECSAGCMSGYHGLTCNYTCSEHCLNRICDQTTGECSAGCESGYQGPTCKTSITAVEIDSSNNGVLPIVLPVVILLALLAVGCVLLVIFRRKIFLRRRSHDPEPCELQELLMQARLDETVRNQIVDLRRGTQHKIESLTSGIIHVSAVDTVVDMLQRGKNWVTITGNAGDGKTTLGYMVLKQLRGKFSVYNIEEPEEYKLLLRLNENRVIMFDDRFGAFTSDQVLIDKWKTVMNDIHKQFTLNGNKTNVIFISRKNVVNEARVFLGHFRDNILDSENVVDLSLLKIKDERLQILDYYLKQGNLKISAEVKQRVANLDIAHGFPHCSMMYPKLKAKKRDLDIEEFFNTPLKFLDVTTSVLYNKNCKDFFELMIKNDGRFDVYSVEDDTRRTSLLRVKREQEGSYIPVGKKGVCLFAHPSIYESVLSVICETDSLFCVKYATLSVIRQKLILTSEEKLKSPTHINVEPVEPVLKALIKRFKPEILQGDYSVFRHRFCDNEDFCKEIVASCVYIDLAAPEQKDPDMNPLIQDGSKQFINQPGRGGVTMLWTALMSGRMTAVQSLVKAGANVNIQNKRGRTPLHYLLQLQHSTAADDDQQRMIKDNIRVIITEGRGDVNRCDQYGQTSLHFLGHVQNSITVDDMNTMLILITEVGGDLNICDEYGHTPLHYLFKYRQFTAEEIKWIIKDGKGDLNQCEQNKCTPLHYLCEHSSLQVDTVDLVISEGKGDFNKADEYGSTPLFYLCDNENFEFDVVRRIVKNAKGDINKPDTNGITPLHVVCKGSHQVKDILTLIHQGDKADMFGNTPLHFLCRRRGINVDVLQQQLKHIPEDVLNTQNSLGYTPLDYLTDQDDQLPWRDGLIQRSAADLVLCSFNLQDRRLVVLAPAMNLNSERVPGYLQVEDFSQELNNMAWSGDSYRPGQFREFCGTCSSPVPVPPSPSPFSLPTYWETHSRLTWREGIGSLLLQIGVVEGEDNRDKGFYVSRLPGSVCVSVEVVCLRHVGLCIKVLRGHQVGDCVTLPLPTPGEDISFKFGVVLDVGRGRVGVIDVERREILGKVDQKFTELVFPMFHVLPFGHRCRTRMRLVSGREISINDRKIKLIQQVLSD